MFPTRPKRKDSPIQFYQQLYTNELHDHPSFYLVFLSEIEWEKKEFYWQWRSVQELVCNKKVPLPISRTINKQWMFFTPGLRSFILVYLKSSVMALYTSIKFNKTGFQLAIYRSTFYNSMIHYPSLFVSRSAFRSAFPGLRSTCT